MRCCFLILFILLWVPAHVQEVSDEAMADLLELQTENAEELIEDESWIDQLAFFRLHPLNINTAAETELAQLLLLTPIQIGNLIRYRSLLGPFIHVNELQAVPGWNIDLIRKLLPYITITDNSFSIGKIWERLSNGRKLVLFRTALQLNNNAPSSEYPGGPESILVKLQYNYGNLLQSGLLIEKDAGEAWMQKGRFDFTSFHFFARELGMIKKIALGDFQLNIGQGLIQWQGIGLKKSANTIMIKTQDEVLRPYRSAGEINFHRGMAITFGKRQWEWTVFGSIRKLDAHVDEDSVNGRFVSSFLNSGYHRTPSEISGRSKLKQVSTGGRVSYSIRNGRVGLNLVNFNYSLPVQGKNEPYQLYRFKGRSLLNWSINYHYTLRNLHLFGEFAGDQQFNKAWLNGVLMSLDQHVDLSILIRSIASSYTSMNTNAFTEYSAPVNETGLYTGASIRFSQRFRLEAYADIFHFPWLKYRVDGPSIGTDYLFQFTWQPNRRLAVYGRWKIETKEENSPQPNSPTNTIRQVQRINFRTHISWDCSRTISLRERWETSMYKSVTNIERGFLMFTDLNIHPSFKPFDFSCRLLLFETDGHNSRIYTFEKNVLNGFSVPFFSGKGIHSSLNLHLDLKNILRLKYLNLNQIGFWISVSETLRSVSNQHLVMNAKANPDRDTTIRVQLIIQ